MHALGDVASLACDQKNCSRRSLGLTHLSCPSMNHNLQTFSKTVSREPLTPSIANIFYSAIDGFQGSSQVLRALGMCIEHASMLWLRRSSSHRDVLPMLYRRRRIHHKQKRPNTV